MDDCAYDPSSREGPIGMHHCPLCGEMVVAGLPHPALMSDQELSDSFAEYMKNKGLIEPETREEGWYDKHE